MAVIFLTTVDKHANILVKPLPEHQELVHISVHKMYTNIGWPLAH